MCMHKHPERSIANRGQCFFLLLSLFLSHPVPFRFLLLFVSLSSAASPYAACFAVREVAFSSVWIEGAGGTRLRLVTSWRTVMACRTGLSLVSRDKHRRSATEEEEEEGKDERRRMGMRGRERASIRGNSI